MKRNQYKFIIAGGLVLLTSSYACKKYLSSPPVGTLNSTVLANKAGVDGLLIGAYSLLDGYFAGIYENWASPISNWTYGGIASDDAIKGSSSNDQLDAATISNHSVDATNGYLPGKWDVQLNGIQRANDVLRELPLVKDGSVTPAYAAELTAEARFLRGFYEMEMVKCWGPYAIYVDETVTYAAGNLNIANGKSILPQVEADFKAAMGALPSTQPQVGRANKYAAEAFLAKAYMFEHNYTAAKPLLADLINNGVNSGGTKYALNKHFADNFNPSLKNSSEGVFEVQMSVHDGSSGANGNEADILNFPLGGPTSCCGFYQPSFSLVNSYKVDANGLPLLDTWNATDLKNDQGLSPTQAFTPATDAVDPRLDWTVGRRGIPYLDWGIMPGASWIREQSTAGPYCGIKSVFYQAAAASTSDNDGGWAQGEINANNYKAIRFADVILWAAECEVEIGSQAQAEIYVNLIRARAADPTGYVHTYTDPINPIAGFTNTPAANYKIGLYTGQIATGTKDFARKAVWFERKLELAMEGHRFFDLQRYDGRFGGPEPAGYMAGVMNAYIAHETNIPNFLNPVQKGATFTVGKNEIYPLPIAEVDKAGGTLKQADKY